MDTHMIVAPVVTSQAAPVKDELKLATRRLLELCGKHRELQVVWTRQLEPFQVDSAREQEGALERLITKYAGKLYLEVEFFHDHSKDTVWLTNRAGVRFPISDLRAW